MFGVLLISSIFTIIIAFIQIFIDYQSHLSATEEQLNIIAKGYTNGIAQSVWDLNSSQQEAQYQGILNIPGMSYVEFINTDNKIGLSRGVKPKNAIIRELPVTYTMATGREVSLGTLAIHADLNNIYDKVLDKFILILSTQFIKTLSVTLIILWFIQVLLTQHLVKIEHHLKKLNLKESPQKLTLDRGAFTDCNDELDSLMHSINEISSELYHYAQHLEQRVADRTQALEHSTKAKSQFLANMSHELRTPMNGVLGMLELVKDTSLNADQHRFIQTAYQSGSTLLKVLNDILDLSKIELGKINIEAIDFEIDDVIDSTFGLLGESAHKKKVELVYHKKNHPPSAVIGDPTRLQQILCNLVGNAIKFTNEGHICVSWGIIDGPEESEHKTHILFNVEDTGIGIPKSALNQIFERFSQADNSNTRKFGGTGLGLSLCLQLVNLMEGEIGVESKIDQGSTFWFSLPFGISVSASEKSDPTNPPTQTAVNQMLVVDNNTISSTALSRILEELGISSEILHNATQFTERLERNSHPTEDAVMIDLSLNDLNPTQIIRFINNNPAYQDIPVIFMGALSQLHDYAFKYKDNHTRLIPKPFSKNKIIETLNTIHSKPSEPKPSAQSAIEPDHTNRSASTVSLNSTVPLEASVYSELPQREPSTRQTAHFLLVEDNIVNQKVATGFFHKLGFTLDIADNGAEALEMLKEKSYDIIFMDCHMPIMDGFQATRRIRELERQQKLANNRELASHSTQSSHSRAPFSPAVIIAITANAMEGDMEACIQAGMNDYLSKPINFKALSGLIQKWMLERKQA